MNQIIEPQKTKDIVILKGQCYFSIASVAPIISNFRVIFEFNSGSNFVDIYSENTLFPKHFSFSLNRGADKMFHEAPSKISIQNDSEHQIIVYACCW